MNSNENKESKQQIEHTVYKIDKNKSLHGERQEGAL